MSNPETTHRIHQLLTNRNTNSRVGVHLVGCGGNGCQMLTSLARLHLAMVELGMGAGLHVTAYDPDTVSVANVGRQLFSAADLGLPKATVLVHRLNAFFSLDWDAVTARWGAQFDSHGLSVYSRNQADILISCVDTAAARRKIHQLITTKGAIRPLYWLDLGNEQHSGQVVLGQPRPEIVQVPYGRGKSGGPYDRVKTQERQPRLPMVTELYPELLDETVPEDDRPSCSLAAALETQDLFVNDQCAAWGKALLWRLFREGELSYHAVFFDLSSGVVRSLPVPGRVTAVPGEEAREAVAA